MRGSYTGETVWLPPYITENLDARVISYNVPIYKDGLTGGISIAYFVFALLFMYIPLGIVAVRSILEVSPTVP